MSEENFPPDHIHQEEVRAQPTIPNEEQLRSEHSPIKFSGPMPEAMKKAFQQRQAEKAGTAKKQHRPASGLHAQPRATGSNRLEGLIQGLVDKSAIHEEITLPSRGFFYEGEDGPEDGKLHVRPMTGEEEEILATPRLVRKGQAINMIFHRCIKEGFRGEDLLSEDRTFLLIWLRGISYGHLYDVEVKCPTCQRPFGHQINLDELTPIFCPEDYKPPLSGVLPRSGYRFNYRLPRGRDETAIQDHRDRNLKMFGDTGTDDTLIYRTALLLEDIEGLDNKDELVMLIKKLPIQDVSHLRNAVTEPPFGVDTKVTIYCPACTHDFEIDLPMEANFFFPKKKKERTRA